MLPYRKLTAWAFLAWAAAVTPLAAADAGPGASGRDWPRWRGVDGDGRPRIKDVIKDFSGGLKKIWQVRDLCKGSNSASWSAPAIKGEKLVVPGRWDDRDVIFCLNADTGEPIWRKDYPAPGKIEHGNGPRATASLDGDRAYTFGAMGHLACWELAGGKRVWMSKVEDEGGKRPEWGHASSPLIYQDKVIVQGGGRALVIAYDKKSGERVWKYGAGNAGYAAPIIATVQGKPQLIVFAAAGLIGLDPSDGRRLWAYPFRTAHDMNCTTPIIHGETVLISSSTYRGQGGSALLKLTGSGVEPLWRNRKLGAAHTDPVILNGHIYSYSGSSTANRGFVCADLRSGRPKWTSADVGGPGTVLLVDGQLMCLSNRGKLALLRPDPKSLQKLTEFQAIRGQPVWTVPVIARDKLYVRFKARLICYQLKGG